ncbi:MAG: hypothetical protein RIG61_07235 [Deltaproteobacteria bacterium]
MKTNIHAPHPNPQLQRGRLGWGGTEGGVGEIGASFDWTQDEGQITCTRIRE